MKLFTRARAFLGLAYDIAKILLFPDRLEAEPPRRAADPTEPEPVVRVTPAAAAMVARAAPPPRAPAPAAEPLEGSIEARRRDVQSG